MNHMRIWTRVCAAVAVCLACAAVTAAQNANVSGQVLDTDAKPWQGVSVQVKSDIGRTYNLTTDKDGKFNQIGLTPGVYTVTFIAPPRLPAPGYQMQRQVSSGDNDFSVTFQKIAAKQGQNPEEQKKREEAKNQFAQMKTHVDAGIAALSDAEEQRKQLRTAASDQKQAVQDKMKSDYDTAITELTQAEQLVGAKDTKNHAVILSNLAIAQNLAGKYDDSVSSYQKAIGLNPQPGYYVGLSQALANSIAGQNDPAAITSKISEAGSNCDKAAALDTTPANTANTARCWKNIGIVLTNKSDMKDAVAPLQKASTIDAKDPQTWYLLGNAYTGLIEPKQEGDKMTYVVPPGASDAYQKCIDAEPNGPYAAQCKQGLDGLAALAGGESTAVGMRPKSSTKSSKKK